MKPFMTIFDIVLAVIIGIATDSYTMPLIKQIRYNTTINSQSYIESKNTHLVQIKSNILEIETKMSAQEEDSPVLKSLDVQKAASLQQMCQIIATMKDGTVDNNIVSFINQNGGC